MRPIPRDEIRPVLATDPRWTSEAVELQLDRQVVRVGDEGGRLRGVLDACDGRRNVAELTEELGTDASELVNELLDLGALVDVDGSWRRFHRISGNPPPVARLIPDEEGEALAGETYAPDLPMGEPIALSAVTTAVGEAARHRRSGRAEPDPRPLRWEELSTLLSVAYGRGESWFGVPSAGALYPLVLHVLVRKPIGPLEPGVWWYEHWRGALHRQDAGRPPVEPLLFSHPVTDPLVARDEPLITISADLRRTCRKYGARGYRFALMETGAVMQTLYLLGAELGIPVRACGGYSDVGMNTLLQHRDGLVCMLVVFAGA